VTLGGRRVEASRPRARTVDGHEAPLEAHLEFAADDLLGQVVLERMLAGSASTAGWRRLSSRPIRSSR